MHSQSTFTIFLLFLNSEIVRLDLTKEGSLSQIKDREMHRFCTTDCWSCRSNEKWQTPSSVMWNLSSFEVGARKFGNSKNQYFCIFPLMETAFIVGEEELCCLVAADHHERRQTNK